MKLLLSKFHLKVVELLGAKCAIVYVGFAGKLEDNEVSRVHSPEHNELIYQLIIKLD